MTKANRKPRTAKGAVLIMVLTVMFVMIFLLAGTIAVVYSANTRAMAKYQESQAYYTARSVLDTYFDALLKDNDASSAVSVNYYYVDKDPTSPTGALKILSMSQMTQGRALELDLYKVPVSTVRDSSDPNFNKWYDEKMSAGSFDEKYMNLTSSDVTGDTEGGSANFYRQFTTTPWNAATMTKGVDDVIVYKVSDFNANDFQKENLTGSDEYNKLSDVGAGNVWIEVQVLERSFSLDNSYTEYYKQFKYGDKTKDHFKIKVTSHVLYNGEETTTSRIFANKDVTMVPSSKAIVSVSNASGNDTLVAIGGAATLGTIIAQNNPDTAGDVFINGDLDSGSTDPTYRLKGDNTMVVKGDFRFNNTPGTNLLTGATIVVGGTMALSGSGRKLQPEDGGQGINVIGKTIDFRSTDFDWVKGRIFADNIIFNGLQNGKLHIDGDAYTNYLTLKKDNGVAVVETGNHITVYVDMINATTSTDDNGSVRKAVSGTIYVSKGINVCTATDGSGGYTYDSFSFSDIGNSVSYNGGTYILDNIFIPATAKVQRITGLTGDRVNADYNDPICFDYDTATHKRTFTLPEKPIGAASNKLTVDTVRSLYDSYFKETVTAADGATETLGDTWGPYGDFNTTFTNASGGSVHLDMSADASGVTLEPLPERWQVQGMIDSSAYPTQADFGWNWDAWMNYWYDFYTADIVERNNQALAAVTGPVEDFLEEHLVYTDFALVNDTNLTGDDSHWTQAREDECAALGLPAIANAYTYVISADKQLSYSDTAQKKVAIDTRTGPVNIQFGNGSGGTFAGTFEVIGDFPCNFLFPDNGSPVSYTLGPDSSNVFFIYDTDLGLDPSPLRLGSTTNPTPPPNINYRCGRNVEKLNFAQGSQGHVLQGYFSAPFTIFDLGGGNNGSNVSIIYDNVFSFNETIAFAGSVFCKGYTSNQKPGVAYISNDQLHVNHGQTLFNWGTNYALIN